MLVRDFKAKSAATHANTVKLSFILKKKPPLRGLSRYCSPSYFAVLVLDIGYLAMFVSKIGKSDENSIY
jgi:hypothetical protein